MITKEKAKDLAVSCAAWAVAIHGDNENEKIVWTRVLRKAQRAAGVKIIDDHILNIRAGEEA
jgi:hypothetical protein